jgi:hypothetical protein
MNTGSFAENRKLKTENHLMDLARLTAWRNLGSKLGALFCCLALATLLDGLIAQFLEPANVIKALPGDTVEVNGPLSREVQSVQDLVYWTEADFLSLKVEELHKGYFLGGDMWRGRLTVSPQAPPGVYSLMVTPRGVDYPKPPPAFEVRVLANPASLQKSQKSWARYYLGISPFLVAGVCVPFILAAFGAVFLLSGRRDAALAQRGLAEIYRVARHPDGLAIHFGLGARHGLAPGNQVQILDGQGKPLALTQVQEAGANEAWALAPEGVEVKPGYLVQRS